MESRGKRLEMESPCSVTISRDADDREWDDFVEFEASGQFEQTSRWAQVKREAGWEPLRILVYRDGNIVAGTQILLRRAPLIGALGYLPKGPVIQNDHPSLALRMMNEIKGVLQVKRIRFLIAQPPNNGSDIEAYLSEAGFKKDSLFGVISATTAIDLTQTYEAILSRMTRNFRYNFRFAERNGVIIRDGKREEIGLFFNLMLETCRRQRVDPNPSTESFIQKLWDVFSPHGNIRFFLAEYHGEIVSGLICIPFGKVFNAWKMGWSGKYENSRAVHLLHWKAIQSAKDNGYHSYDFMGINRSLAETILGGNHFYKVAKGANLFKLSFGGEVRLLPEACYYFKSPLLRLLYTKVYPYFRKIKRAIV